MAHTPGPWIAVGTRVYFEGNAGGFDLVNCPDALDNARLTAAAPELLKTLEEIEERADEKMGEWSSVAFAYLPEDMETLYELRQAARDAIAKYRGEA